MSKLEELRSRLDEYIDKYGLLSAEVAVVADELHKAINQEMKKQTLK